MSSPVWGDVGVGVAWLITSCLLVAGALGCLVPVLPGHLILNPGMETTDYTDYTDLEYVMSLCPITQKVNVLTAISNPILSVKSVKISVISGKCCPVDRFHFPI